MTRDNYLTQPGVVIDSNLYTYAANCPGNFVDPSGRFTSLGEMSVSSAIMSVLSTQVLVGLGLLTNQALGTGISVQLPDAVAFSWSGLWGPFGGQIEQSTHGGYPSVSVNFGLGENLMDIVPNSRRPKFGQFGDFELGLKWGQKNSAFSTSVKTYFPLSVARVATGIVKAFGGSNGAAETILRSIFSGRGFVQGSIGFGFDSNGNSTIYLSRKTKWGSEFEVSLDAIATLQGVLNFGDLVTTGIGNYAKSAVLSPDVPTPPSLQQQGQ